MGTAVLCADPGARTDCRGAKSEKDAAEPLACRLADCVGGSLCGPQLAGVGDAAGADRGAQLVGKCGGRGRASVGMGTGAAGRCLVIVIRRTDRDAGIAVSWTLVAGAGRDRGIGNLPERRTV